MYNNKIYFEKILTIINNNKIIAENADYVCNSNIKLSLFPSIYYIGMGKTGSVSLLKGFPKNYVAHYHGISSFEKIYNTNILSVNNIDLYDIVLYIGQKIKFKPLIIECIREPIGQMISVCMQHLKFDRDCNCNLCKWKLHNKNMDELLEIIKNRINVSSWINSIQSIKLYKKHFGINLLEEFDIKKNITIMNWII